jgi:hypothetical protein
MAEYLHPGPANAACETSPAPAATAIRALSRLLAFMGVSPFLCHVTGSSNVQSGERVIRQLADQPTVPESLSRPYLTENLDK